MNICLCSAFRDSCEYLQRYLAQVTALDEVLHARGDKLSFVWGEGDSTDHTRRTLNAARFRFNAVVVDCSHGGTVFDSVVVAERFRQLAHVGRCIFAEIPKTADVVVWVESDLVWQPETIVGLIDRLGDDVAAVAPSIILHRDGWPSNTWYDTHCYYTADGKHFKHRPPYHVANTGGMMEMGSVGSCVAMDAVLARAVTIDERVIMGICEDIRKMGGRIWYDPTLPAIVHH